MFLQRKTRDDEAYVNFNFLKVILLILFLLILLEKRDAGARRFSEQKIIPPRADSPNSTTPNSSTDTDSSKDVSSSTSTNKNTERVNSSASFFALPTSVRKDMMSKNVVNSIFDDDMFGSATPSKKESTPKPKPVRASPPVSSPEFVVPEPNTVTQKEDIFSLFPSSNSAPATIKKEQDTIIPQTQEILKQETIVTPKIPETNTVKSNIITDDDLPPIETLSLPLNDPEPQPEPKPKDEEIEIVTVNQPPKKVEIPPIQKTPEPVAPQVNKQQISSTPTTTTTTDIKSLPSPFGDDVFIPPRDGGMGESPKARLMQEKLFFRYVNAYLAQGGVAMNQFNPDFLNGVMFIMFVEKVTHIPMPENLISKCKVNPETQNDKYLNFYYATQHLKDIGKPLPVISIESLYSYYF